MTYGYATPGAIVALEDDRNAYAEYVREITGDGDSIVECLISIMKDDDAKPYEKLDAQLLLDSIGYGRLAAEQAEAADALPQPDNPDPPRAANPRRRAAQPLLSPKRPSSTSRLSSGKRQTTARRWPTSSTTPSTARSGLQGPAPHKGRQAAHGTRYSRDRDPNYGLGEIDPDSTMRLIETLTAEFKERKAREKQEAALQPVPSLLDVLQPPCQCGECNNPGHGDGQTPDSADGLYPSVLDYPTCPSNHTYECECFEEERERQEAHRELDQIMRERFLPSQDEDPP